VSGIPIDFILFALTLLAVAPFHHQNEQRDDCGDNRLEHAILPNVIGAAPTTAMTHIAIQETLDGKAVNWMEKVSDEQYGT
jgi:hypothetical protein